MQFPKNAVSISWSYSEWKQKEERIHNIDHQEMKRPHAPWLRASGVVTTDPRNTLYKHQQSLAFKTARFIILKPNRTQTKHLIQTRLILHRHHRLPYHFLRR